MSLPDCELSGRRGRAVVVRAAADLRSVSAAAGAVRLALGRRELATTDQAQAVVPVVALHLRGSVRLGEWLLPFQVG